MIDALRRALPAIACCVSVLSAQAQTLSPDQRQLRAIYQEMVETNTTDSVGSCTVAAQLVAARLKAGGYADSDMQLIIPPGGPKKGMLVARLKGSGAMRPLLLVGHLDVIEAKRADWTRDPFTLIEEDGYFYARGTFDNKAQASIFVSNMLRYKRDKYRPRRDLILALTCDEEMLASEFDGIDYLLKHHRELIQADLGLIEGGVIALAPDGTPLSQGLQAGEKVALNFKLEVTSKGGHSSLPVPDNAIVHLADGLSRIGKFNFPFKLSPTTRNYFERTAEIFGGTVGADMKAILAPTPDMLALARLGQVNAFYTSSVRTTCTPTLVDAGHASNALPQRAQAVVNCRILPGESPDDVLQTLVRVLADDQIRIAPEGKAVLAKAPPLDPALIKAVQELTNKMWPGLPVLPTMAVGATDARFLNEAGIWTYGVSGLMREANGGGIHGLNERLRVKSLYEAQTFLYELAKLLAD